MDQERTNRELKSAERKWRNLRNIKRLLWGWFWIFFFATSFGVLPFVIFLLFGRSLGTVGGADSMALRLAWTITGICFAGGAALSILTAKAKGRLSRVGLASETTGAEASMGSSSGEERPS